MSPERLMKFIPAILAAVLMIAILLFLTSAPKAQKTGIALDADLKSAACNGSVTLSAELKDEDGKRVPDALVTFNAGEMELDSLYTDRNGRVGAEFPLGGSWCGRRIDFSAVFEGNDRLGKSSAVVPLSIRGPTEVTLEAPEESETGETFQVRATLIDARSGNPIPAKPLSIGNLSALTGLNGTAVFNLSFSGSGAADILARFAGDEFFEPSMDTELTRVIPLMCQDGTLVGECSGEYHCTAEKELEADCEVCGCSGSKMCIGGRCVAEEERLQELIEDLQRSNVKIESDEGIGSGVIIGRNESSLLILTNRHVVDADFAFISNTNLEVFNFDNETAKPIRIYIAPNQLDMAIIVVSKDIGKPAEINYSLKPKIGSEVLVIGTPLGIPNSVTTGIISNYVETNTSSGFVYDVMQTDAAVNPGNSGGGVYLAGSGKMIGIISFKLVIRGRQGTQLAEGLGFAIPVNLVEDYPLDEWRVIPPN